VGLFMGKSALEGVWPRIVGWLGEPTPTALHRVQARSIESVE
jgi:hypothetical protein